jgi:hypothetical protein
MVTSDSILFCRPPPGPPKPSKGVCDSGLTKKCGAAGLPKGLACKKCAKALEKSQPAVCPVAEVVRAWERAHC